MVDESTKKMLEEQFPGWKVVEPTPHIPNPHLKNILPGPDIEQLKAKYLSREQEKNPWVVISETPHKKISRNTLTGAEITQIILRDEHGNITGLSG